MSESFGAIGDADFSGRSPFSDFGPDPSCAFLLSRSSLRVIEEGRDPEGLEPGETEGPERGEKQEGSRGEGTRKNEGGAREEQEKNKDREIRIL